MLILHQTGSVKVGEVIRYTLTYTPSADRILPAPSHLHVKIKNTSAIPLRAAYLHGPYTLYAATYPSTFNPNEKHTKFKDEGEPEYEPNLKAGGYWTSKLKIPDEIRESAGRTRSRRSVDGPPKSFTWVIEVAAQVIFSTTAAVHFELLVGRDERSVELGFHAAAAAMGHGAPGKLEDHQQGRDRNNAQPTGVFSKAVQLVVEDTASLWNKPPFPGWDNTAIGPGPMSTTQQDGIPASDEKKPRNKKKIHLVVITHGLHSNTGADMLYLKESIDHAAKQAREDAKKHRTKTKEYKARRESIAHRDPLHRTTSAPDSIIAPTDNIFDDEDEDEEVLVRGFNGNVVRTERGIQYLGKRLAKYVLSITYPDQPYLPVKSSISRSITRSLTLPKTSASIGGKPVHRSSSIIKDEEHTHGDLPYQITSISFISHSLGGLIQTYAIAYIQKHSPEFFDNIKPINFVAMASPFLGLSNENPMYVKFALDFGLVGRTGQDLGLTWRTPAIVRGGWGAMIGGLGSNTQKAQQQPDPGSKPLLRILPTGPAHIALKRFRNRSVYSNVVNDGIVPLRTSCLLFLDWKGLGRVEKARRENGLVGTMVGWGWAEMTGQNATAKKLPWSEMFSDSGEDSDSKGQRSTSGLDHDVPQAETGGGFDDETLVPRDGEFLQKPYQDEVYDQDRAKESQKSTGPWASLVSYFKPHAGSKAHHHPPKHTKIYARSQTTMGGGADGEDSGSVASVNDESIDASKSGTQRQGLVRGSSAWTNNPTGGVEAPPKTTFFESAGDLLNPPLPPKEFLLDPAARPRTIFHDRIYHPEDIPPPPVRHARSLLKRTISKDSATSKDSSGRPQSASATGDSIAPVTDDGAMKIEEKIARAYHKDMSWRKVLVRLEPDAHNNMVVRRMFANAYGWPVVKHLCDTHFAYTAAAKTRDSDERTEERAKPVREPAGERGEEVKGQTDQPREPDSGSDTGLERRHSQDDMHDDDVHTRLKESDLGTELHGPRRTDSELRESKDEVADLVTPGTAAKTAESSFSSLKGPGSRTRSYSGTSKHSRQGSAKWSDRFFEESDDYSDDEQYFGQAATKEMVDQHRQQQQQQPQQSTTAAGKSKTTTREESHIVADLLTSSPKQSSNDLRAADKQGMVEQQQRAEEQKREEEMDAERQKQPPEGSSEDAPPPDRGTLSMGMASVGIGITQGKDVGELVSPSSSLSNRAGTAAAASSPPDQQNDQQRRRRRQSSMSTSGIAEQVAFASRPKDQADDD